MRKGFEFTRGGLLVRWRVPRFAFHGSLLLAAACTAPPAPAPPPPPPHGI